MKEVWKNVNGADRYQVSNKGRVRVLDHQIVVDRIQYGKKVHQDYIRHGKILNPQKDNMGYVHVRLYMNDGSVKLFKVHRLVAMHFMKKFDPELQIDHKNGIKTDNRIENLQQMTLVQNLKKAFQQDKRYSYVCLNTKQKFCSFKSFCKRKGLSYSRYFFNKSLDSGQKYNNTDFKFKRVLKAK